MMSRSSLVQSKSWLFSQKDNAFDSASLIAHSAALLMVPRYDDNVSFLFIFPKSQFLSVAPRSGFLKVAWDMGGWILAAVK